MFEDEYKEPTRWWIWFLVALAAILTFLVVYSTVTFNFKTSKSVAITDSTRFAGQNEFVKTVNLPQGEANFEEITLKDISVNGNEEHAIYTAVLFPKGQAALDGEARRKLVQISRSITRRFNNGPIEIYSYADTVGTVQNNLELTRRRASQVKTWLVQQGGIPAANITIFPQGESVSRLPDDSPFTQSDFERRIEIMARVDKTGLAPVNR